MDPKPPPGDKPPATQESRGYQPSPGRKLFMLCLCILGLILIWTFYWMETRTP